ncbi:uncharacterized protein [Periplaneta americana]|uniref:uncharacterized protein n=1 Tax=Periplaneta americana TaxID=6978 RepID=UPI0037E83AEA
MQESIFDVFGRGRQHQSQLSTVKPSSTGRLKIHKDNVQLKTSNLQELKSTIKPLRDVGNKIHSTAKMQESRKFESILDQENLKTPLIKTQENLKPSLTKTPFQSVKKRIYSSPIQTPDIKQTIRSPLSDIKVKPQVLKQPIPELHISPSHVTENYSLSSLIYKGENYIDGTEINSPWLEPDKLVCSENDDDYEDILPTKLRPTNDDINRMVSFWTLCKNPADNKFSSDLPLEIVEEPDNVQLKTLNLQESKSSVKPLRDVGNKIHSTAKVQESRKFESVLDQENLKTPFTKISSQSAKKEICISPIQTPDIEHTARSSLSDIKMKPQVLKQPIPELCISLSYAIENYSLSSLVHKGENYIDGTEINSPWLEPDKFVCSEDDDNYEDILPMKLRPTEDDINRMVSFWTLCKTPADSKFSSDLLLELVEEPDLIQEPLMMTEVDFDEGLLVPVPVVAVE